MDLHSLTQPAEQVETVHIQQTAERTICGLEVDDVNVMALSTANRISDYGPTISDPKPATWCQGCKSGLERAIFDHDPTPGADEDDDAQPIRQPRTAYGRSLLAFTAGLVRR